MVGSTLDGWRSFAAASRVAMAAVATLLLLLLASCGGGGGGGGPAGYVKGVFTGFTGDPDWEAPADAAGFAGGDGGGSGAGGDGGGAGAGGAEGQFRNALVVVKFPNGQELGRALTDPVRGMVTIRPGVDYNGALLIEIHGQPDAQYFDEGKGVYISFPPGEILRALIPRVTKNIGVTPYTEAAYRLALACQSGEAEPADCLPAVGAPPLNSASTAVNGAVLPSIAHIQAASERVLAIVNQQFPDALKIDDVARLPFIVNDGTARGDIAITRITQTGDQTVSQRGRYGLLNIAFSKQAAMFNTASRAPSLLGTQHLAADLADGKLDGLRFGTPVVEASRRTYDPATFTTELSSALAQQTNRYANTDAVAVLPKLVGYGNVRYDSYYFDARVVPDGTASTVAIATETAIPPGQESRIGRVTDYVRPAGDNRAFMVYGNMGSGSLFIKTDSADSTSRILALGDNTSGELASGTQAPPPRGQTFDITLPGVLTHVAGGMGHTVARFADGSVYAWGDNSYGQLGQGFVAGLPRSATPLKVNLPRGAIAVTASNAASFALLDDGTVYSWGASLGFGTLGDNSKNGQRPSPAPVVSTAGALSGVVQVVARDNDVVALTRDGTVWTWGSYPAPVASGSSQPTGTAGGLAQATPFAGLPAGSRVRKVLTEQALFAALMDDGAIYTWGVYFDITAGEVLYDYSPQRVLNLPPVRDMMPGGFIGYGQRPFDRMTAMAIDYGGQIFRIRGRVAERFDVNDPLRQRRPQGQAPRPDCASCHTVLGKSLPPHPPMSGAPACQAIPEQILSLLNSQSVCEACHNGTPLSTGRVLPLLNCVPPPLPAPPPPNKPVGIATACQLPQTNHISISPGAFCASCHNSVIQAPLDCVATPATTAPPLTTVVTIAMVSESGIGSPAIPQGGLTGSAAPVFSGTLSNVLAAGQVIELLRNGVRVAAASPTGTSFSIADSGLTTGSYTYTVRVASEAALSLPSAPYTFAVDNGVPAERPVIVSVTDNVGLIQADLLSGVGSDDQTPRLNGSLAAALPAGSIVQVFRNDALIGLATVNGTVWTYDDSLSATGTFRYAARVQSVTGVNGVFGDTFNFPLKLGGPGKTATITSMTDNFGPATGTFATSPVTTDDATPRLSGTLSAALGAGETVRLFRNSTTAPVAGNATVNGNTWFFDDLTGLSVGAYSYAARVVDNVGSPGSAANNFIIDMNLGGLQNIESAAANGDPVSPKSINITNPVLTFTISSPFTAGEVLRVQRTGPSNAVGNAVVDGSSPSIYRFSDSGLIPGTYTYTAVVYSAQSVPGNTRQFVVIVDQTAPTNTITEVTITSDVYPTNGNPWHSAVSSTTAVTATLNDTTPTVTVQLASALSSSDYIEIRRNNSAGALICTLSVGNERACAAGLRGGSGSSRTFTETSAQTFSASARAYHVRIVDAAGNFTAGNDRTASVVLNYPACSTWWRTTTPYVHASNLTCSGCHNMTSGRVIAPASSVASSTWSGRDYPNFAQYQCIPP